MPMVEIVAWDVLVVMVIFLSVFQAPGLELLSRTRPVHPIADICDETSFAFDECVGMSPIVFATREQDFIVTMEIAFHRWRCATKME